MTSLEPAPLPLGKLLHASSLLLGLSKSNASVRPTKIGEQLQLADLLSSRIDGFNAAVGRKWLILHSLRDNDEPLKLEEEEAVKLSTARYSLAVLEDLQACEKIEKLKQASEPSSSTTADIPQAPVFGLRDMKTLQMLASLVARWGLAALIEPGVLPAEMQDKPSGGNSTARIKEMDEDNDRRKEDMLEQMTKTTARLVMGDEGQVTAGGGELQAIALPQLMLPTLAALLQLGQQHPWADTDSTRLLNITNPSTAIATLFTLLALKKGTQSNSATWLRPKISSLLSRQLMRPGGVLGLLNVLLGRSETELHISQLEQVARVLTTPPSDTTPEIYFATVLPRMISILRPSESNQAPPPSYIRALCFCISRLITTSPNLVTAHISPFFSLDSEDIEGQLDLLSVLVANIDPSPSNYAFLLAPVTSKLFSIWLHVLETKGDPVLRGAVENLLSIWGRTLSTEEVAEGMSEVIRDSPSYEWQRTESGGVRPRAAGEEREIQDITAIKPDPALVVTWLKTLARPQVTSLLLVQWLDEIRTLQAEPGQEQNFEIQKAIVLRLQLVLKVIEECGSEIVKEAKQTLVFIDYALEGKRDSEKQNKPAHSAKPAGTGLSLSDLKIVENDGEEEDGNDAAEEAEFPELEGIAPGEELAVTGLTLLLAVLEGNEGLSFVDTPILHTIGSKLDRLADSQTPTISRLARDANMVLSLRRAASQASSKLSNKDEDGLSASRQLYQDALKLLQDPILPIRAQGLSMLRSLVASKSTLFTTDPALIPAILDIFVQAVQDDDSFLYLNAVQGLSVMTDSFGKDIAGRLMNVYLGKDPNSVGEGERGRRELDKRLRVGEAVVQVVQRSDQALPVYIDSLVPPLLHVLRTQTLPVALRSSALTILATAAETSLLSLTPYRSSLADACLDLLSLESRSRSSKTGSDETPDPLQTASTHVSLRRGGLLFLGLLLRASAPGFDYRTLRRLETVSSYLRETDGDALVRHNAGEVLEDCQALLHLLLNR